MEYLPFLVDVKAYLILTDPAESEEAPSLQACPGYAGYYGTSRGSYRWDCASGWFR